MPKELPLTDDEPKAVAGPEPEVVAPINAVPLPRNVSTEAFAAFLLRYSALKEAEIKGIIGTVLRAKKEVSSRNSRGIEPKWTIVSASPEGVRCYVTTKRFNPEHVGNRLPVEINFPTVEGAQRHFRKELVTVLGSHPLKARPIGSRLSSEVKTSMRDEPSLPLGYDNE